MPLSFLALLILLVFPHCELYFVPGTVRHPFSCSEQFIDVISQTTTRLYIPGFAPQAIIGDILGVDGEGRTTWGLHDGQSRSSGFLGTGVSPLQHPLPRIYSHEMGFSHAHRRTQLCVARIRPRRRFRRDNGQILLLGIRVRVLRDEYRHGVCHCGRDANLHTRAHRGDGDPHFAAAATPYAGPKCYGRALTDIREPSCTDKSISEKHRDVLYCPASIFGYSFSICGFMVIHEVA